MVSSDYFSYKGILRLGSLTTEPSVSLGSASPEARFAATIDYIRSNPALWNLFTEFQVADGSGRIEDDSFALSDLRPVSTPASTHQNPSSTFNSGLAGASGRELKTLSVLI